MLLVCRSLLVVSSRFVVCRVCLLFVVRSLLFVVRCLLSVVCYSAFDVCCGLSDARCLLFVVCLGISRWLLLADC